ncbi:MAG: hypothetical protein ACJ75K_22200 [Actinomycetes bacterium]
MGQQTRMVYYADLLHATPAAIGADACTLDEAVAAMVADAAAAETAGDGELDDGDLLAGLTPEGQRLALRLSMTIAAQAASQPAPPTAEVLPLPASLRRLLLRQLLQRLIPDADAYFFTDRKEPIRQRLRQALDAVPGPVVLVTHSLGTVIAYDVLSEARFAGEPVPLLVTLGSPLGYAEIQDVVTRPLRLPAPVRLWANFADPFDIVALDSTLADDYRGGPRIVDARVDNPAPNNHAACGYLGASRVRTTVNAAMSAAPSG